MLLDDSIAHARKPLPFARGAQVRMCCGRPGPGLEVRMPVDVSVWLGWCVGVGGLLCMCRCGGAWMRVWVCGFVGVWVSHDDGAITPAVAGHERS